MNAIRKGYGLKYGCWITPNDQISAPRVPRQVLPLGCDVKAYKQQDTQYGGNVCPARARRATFQLTIPTSAQDLPSDGEGPPNRP